MKRDFESRLPKHWTVGGSVLIVVLWVCLSLVSVTLLFGHSMLMAYRGSDNDLSGRQADQAIEGAARYAGVLLLNAETPGKMPLRTAYESEAVPIGEATVWFLGRTPEAKAGTTREFGLVDEGSKLNLNTATPAMLQALPGMTEAFAAAIVDWRDTDDELTPGGAETEYYMRLQPAYRCKNEPFESIEELALLSGADRLLIYGEDANLNGVLDPNEDDGDTTPPEDNSDGKLDSGILEYVTVFSREQNKRNDGTARISVNPQSQELTDLLTEKFGASRRTEILGRLGPVPARSVLEFVTRGGMTSAEYILVEDALTFGTDEYRSGLINVNTAPEAVLACLPGVGVDNAATLVATRLGRSEQDTDITWLGEVLGAEAVVAAGPYVTGRTSQVTADVAAVGRHGRGYRRTRFVIDQSTGTPRIIYRRNLAPLGWALGDEVRQALIARTEAR